jgi:hypothetical protein
MSDPTAVPDAGASGSLRPIEASRSFGAAVW